MNKDDRDLRRRPSRPGRLGDRAASCSELGFTNLLLRTQRELDLRNQAAVDAFFARSGPTYVFLAAAKVGGIHANSTYPADFLRDNLQIQTNVIDAAWRHGVRSCASSARAASTRSSRRSRCARSPC